MASPDGGSIDYCTSGSISVEEVVVKVANQKKNKNKQETNKDMMVIHKRKTESSSSRITIISGNVWDLI